MEIFYVVMIMIGSICSLLSFFSKNVINMVMFCAVTVLNFSHWHSLKIKDQIKKSEHNIIIEIQKAHQISRVKYLDDKLMELGVKTKNVKTNNRK